MKRPPHLSLPVDGLLDEVLGMLAVRPALVLRAPTGSGKTTRVPPALELAGLGPVLLVEPRRVAARAAARRMASERGEAVGESVGYRVRVDKKVSAKTRVCAVTGGVFVRQVPGVPLLEGVGCVVVGACHVRPLEGDPGVAGWRRVQLETRPDLKIVVLSATIDPGPLEVFLEAAVVDAPGKLFPIEVGFQAPRGREAIEAQVVRAVEATAGWLGEQQRKGAGVGRDMLVFLPGKGEIRRAEEALGRSLAGRLGLEVVPLHGDLDAKAQDRVLAPRKATEAARVILATNLAESSLTLDGLGAVIDSGLARIPRFDPGAGLDRLELVRIAMPSVLQRMGRAGRTGPGYNLRLWSPAEERTLPSGLEPEVARVDLTGALLSLADFGEPDPLAFDWFELPPRASSERGLALLRALGALGANAGITARGRVLATLPIHPRLGLLLLVGAERGIAERAALAAAVLSERDVCAGALAELEPERVHDSDLLERVELLEAVLAGRGPRRLSRGATGELFRIRDQLLRLTPKKRRNVAVPTTRDDSDEALLHSLFEAYPDRVSKRRGSSSEERTGARGGRGRLLQRVGGAGVDGARAQMVGGRGLALGNECRVREAEL
ncbi:MAG: ATP-dependent helicase HrpB, partial [Planctomycetes bacterium]|nr:ATP-dependent helicase HrpB [Planctomycetota bacterium]